MGQNLPGEQTLGALTFGVLQPRMHIRASDLWKLFVDFGELTSVCKGLSVCNGPKRYASRPEIALHFQNRCM
jgi:hypothetical protein